MTTSITIILNNNDLINHIYSFLSSVDDKTVIACINKTLYEVFRSKSYFTIQQDNLKQKIDESKKTEILTTFVEEKGKLIPFN